MDVYVYLNHGVLQAGLRILDLFDDLRDGHNLISLLEVLAHDILVSACSTCVVSIIHALESWQIPFPVGTCSYLACESIL